MTRSGLRRVLGFAAALVMTTAFAGGAWAQGMYYKELEKDGRIYVFNDAKRAAAFEQSGEVGTGLTRLGVGPNGETVVADSEQALELFFFKHGIAETVERPKKPKMEVSWKDGKTTIATDKAELKLSNRIQTRWTQELPDDTVQLAGTPKAGDARGSFRIRRAKTKFEGWFYNKNLTYELQLNWPDLSGSPASRALEDAWIGWDPSKTKAFQIKFGQFKVPFGRQELTSSGSQQFVDRTDVSNRYARGRETGVQLWGEVAKGKLEWRVGAFNGNGRSQSANDNGKYQYNARVQFAPNGDPKLSEGDFESKDTPLWAVAVAFESNDRTSATSNVDVKDTILAGDLSFKYKGFAVAGEYFNRRGTPETGSKFKDKGWYAQAGYLFSPKRQWEIAFRYGQIDPTDLKSGDDRTEIGGALSYYYNKHNLKVQADWRQLKDDAGNGGKGTTNNELRVQTQFIF